MISRARRSPPTAAASRGCHTSTSATASAPTPPKPPMIGTDLGEEFDDNFVFPPGMVLVLEPVVWEDGTGGYRSEEIVVITEDGFTPITDYPYSPLWRLRFRPTAGHCGRVVGNGRWRRWTHTTSTSWCSAGRPIFVTSPARRSCGSPGHDRSVRCVSWSCVPPETSTSTAPLTKGVPEEIGHDQLYGLAWNPMTLIEVLKKIDGARPAQPRRNRRDHTDFRHVAADCVSECRTRRRRSWRCGPRGGSRRPTKWRR